MFAGPRRRLATRVTKVSTLHPPGPPHHIAPSTERLNLDASVAAVARAALPEAVSTSLGWARER